MYPVPMIRRQKECKGFQINLYIGHRTNITIYGNPMVL